MSIKRTTQARWLALVLAVALLLGAPALAQAPAAGTNIGNQATATYTDGSGTSRSVTSNVVTTVVSQVASFTLTQDNDRFSTAGGLVYFPHTLTNTGNGADSFSLGVVQGAGDDFDLSAIGIYPDSNGDGLPDPGAAVIASTGSLAAGAAFQFVIVGTVPGPIGAASIDVDAASVFDAGQVASNTDTVTVTTGAVVPVTKSVSSPTAAPGGGPYTYTISYTNTGNDTAVNLTLSDLLPAEVSYVPGSGRWSVSGASPMTDVLGGDPAGISYDFAETSAGTVTAVIASVAPGASGTVTFQVDIPAAAAAGTAYNQVDVSYDDGSGTVVNGESNRVPLRILNAPAVDIVGDNAGTVSQGATVTFTNPVTNNGNTVDTFDISLGGSTYPAGTSFVLFKEDGQTPLLDTDATGIPDTGPLAVGGTYNVIVKAILPASFSGNAGYSVDVTARSTVDTAVSDTGADVVDEIVASTVDLTNNLSVVGGALATDGLGAGPEVNPVTTNAVNPGASTTFTLYVNNISAEADAYVLEASTDATFATRVLPSGWTVQFLDSTGRAIADTGLVSAGSDREVTARVVTAPGSPAGDVEVYFRVSSPTTGAADVKHDRVSVNTVRDLSITPNNTGQVFPGGAVVYSHTIRNNGNVIEGDGVASATTLALSNSLPGFTSVIYWDRDNDGVLDPTDPAITSLADLIGGTNGASTTAGLDIGEGATLFVKVYAPPGAVVGSTNGTEVQATTTAGVYPVGAPAVARATDTTAIISGDLTVDKAQALDADGDFILDGPYTTNLLSAPPGARIRYRVTVTNTGTADANNVVVNDITPAFTTYDVGDGTTSANGVAVVTLDGGLTFTAVTAPAPGLGGGIVANIGTLPPGQTAVVYFGVRVRGAAPAAPPVF